MIDCTLRFSAGQGNCNVGSRQHTKDRWCYINTKSSSGAWLNPTSVCPDARSSKVHHGRYWSNVACDTPVRGNGGGYSSGGSYVVHGGMGSANGVNCYCD